MHEVLDEAERTQSDSLSALNAVRLLIFTGARLSEILGLQWDFLDLDHGRANLPDSKTGARPLYLPEPAETLRPPNDSHHSTLCSLSARSDEAGRGTDWGGDATSCGRES